MLFKEVIDVLVRIVQNKWTQNEELLIIKAGGTWALKGLIMESVRRKIFWDDDRTIGPQYIPRCLDESFSRKRQPVDMNLRSYYGIVADPSGSAV